MDHDTGWCGSCMKRVPAERKGINHILHSILSICTAGIWLLIWIMAAVIRQPWRCGYCGRNLTIVGEGTVSRIEATHIGQQHERERQRNRIREA